MSLLGGISGPSDLKGLPAARLPALAQEIRAFRLVLSVEDTSTTGALGATPKEI